MNRRNGPKKRITYKLIDNKGTKGIIATITNCSLDAVYDIKNIAEREGTDLSSSNMQQWKPAYMNDTYTVKLICKDEEWNEERFKLNATSSLLNKYYIAKIKAINKYYQELSKKHVISYEYVFSKNAKILNDHPFHYITEEEYNKMESVTSKESDN